MKAERLFRVLGLVDEDLVEEAASPAVRQRKFPLKKALAAAACLTLVCGLSFAWLVTGRFHGMGSSAPGESGITTDNGPSSEEGTTFMSYAGPVFPLTLTEETGGLTAERKTIWDFSPGTDHGGTPRQWGATVTDGYTLVNITDSDQTVTALYPFAGSFMELAAQRPTVTVDGEESDGALCVGSYAGSFQGVWQSDGQGGYVLDDTTLNLSHPDSWMDYKALLADGRYLDAALGDGPVLDIPVTVYTFSDFTDPGDDKIDQAVSLTADENITTILSYGFNSLWYNEPDVPGWRQYSYSASRALRQENTPKYLLILGKDATSCTLRSFRRGAEEDTLPENFCTMIRYETTLGEVLDQICQRYYEVEMETGAAGGVPYALFRRAVGELMVQYGPISETVKDRYADGRLDDLISEAMGMDRVLYLAVPVTVPAGGEVNITFELWKEPSFDYGCSGSEHVGLQGYDLVTRLGSTLTFTEQLAALEHTENIQIQRQNFGFDLEKGVTEVTLTPEMEHYYLAIRPKE